MLERIRARRAARARPDGEVRLHVGSGAERLDGWLNVDLKPFRGVDVVADVTEGLPFADSSVEAVYAEHFLEHLRLDDGLDFLAEVHRVLRPGGVLRISTPNLDWVWETHYDPAADPGEKVEAALRANRAFHGWGHRFLWNTEILERAMAGCGFVDLVRCRWGESERPELAGIERHRAHRDTDSHPHVVIVEGAKGAADPERARELRRLAEQELIRYLGG